MSRASFIRSCLRSGGTAADVKHIRRVFNKKRPLSANDVLSCAYYPSMVGRLAYEAPSVLDLMPKTGPPALMPIGEPHCFVHGPKSGCSGIHDLSGNDVTKLSAQEDT